MHYLKAAGFLHNGQFTLEPSQLQANPTVTHSTPSIRFEPHTLNVYFTLQ